MITAAHGGHVVERAARPLPWTAASQLAEDLARDGIYVLIEAGEVVHLTALVPTTTAQEVRVLRETLLLTDSRIAWHPAVADA